jgi:hypothetical protein
MTGIGHVQTHHSSRPTSAWGQSEKNPARAYVFGFAFELGHRFDAVGMLLTCQGLTDKQTVQKVRERTTCKYEYS